MRAQVPYLAVLARRRVGPGPLQPPRRLFADAAYPLDLSAGGEEQAVSPRVTSRPGRGTSQLGEYGTGGAPLPVGSVPVDPAIRAVSAARPAAPDRPDRPGLMDRPGSPDRPGPMDRPGSPDRPGPMDRPGSPDRPGPMDRPGSPDRPGPMDRPGSPDRPRAAAVSPAPAGSVPPPAGPPPSPDPQPPAHAGPPSLVAWWGTPVELPQPDERAPVASQASTWPGAEPAAPSRPGPATGPDQSQLDGGTGAQRTPGGRDAVSDQARDLLPPPAQASRPAERAEPGLGGSRREAGESRREPPGGPASARVSIGAIEVTVVPPVRPAPRATESRPSAPMPRGGSRPAGSVRLRDGLRRWYGIAQG